MKTVRNTRQKKIIYDALVSADHPTATELYESVAGETSISRGTVFRVLSQFAENGEVKKLSFPDMPARFDATITPHAHLCCVRCGKVFDIFDEEIDRTFSKKYSGDFEIYSADVEFTGCCPECKKIT